MRDRDIDFSDIPEASDAQLQAMRRVGRPPLGSSARQLIAIRLDPDVLRWARRVAARQRIGYQTVINDVLLEHVRRSGGDARTRAVSEAGYTRALRNLVTKGRGRIEDAGADRS